MMLGRVFKVQSSKFKVFPYFALCTLNFVLVVSACAQDAPADAQGALRSGRYR